MDAITKQFILPVRPTVAAHQKIVYPWEKTNLYNLCVQLYELAKQTGYENTFEEFKAHFGEYLKSGEIVINIDEYTGQYDVTPLPNIEQILRTDNKILKQDIVVEPIPYLQVSNDAGGYTITIG